MPFPTNDAAALALFGLSSTFLPSTAVVTAPRADMPPGLLLMNKRDRAEAIATLQRITNAVNASFGDVNAFAAGACPVTTEAWPGLGTWRPTSIPGVERKADEGGEERDAQYDDMDEGAGAGAGRAPASGPTRRAGRSETVAPGAAWGTPLPPVVTKGRPLPEGVRRVMLGWFLAHSAHPFPTPAEKTELMRSTGLTAVQIRNWLVNQRKRHWRPTLMGREPRCTFDAAILSVSGIAPGAGAGAGAGYGGGGGEGAQW
jgi:hypothetical protein